MKWPSFFVFACFAPTLLLAQNIPEHLWPANGVPGAKGLAPADVPEITIHRPAQTNGTAVVICPGGGYGALMMSYEGHDVAKWLNEQGITGIVLKYRVAPYHHPAPLQDGQRAMRIVRSRAATLGLNPARIGMMGFSAGGHLASTVGTHFDDGVADSPDPIERVGCRPDFLILVYPVITMGPKGHGGSRDNLLGSNPPAELLDLLSNEKQITARTPPTFLVHARTDRAVPVENSLLFHQALKANGVASEMLELPTGDHGLGTGHGEQWALWQKTCVSWLSGQGLLKR